MVKVASRALAEGFPKFRFQLEIWYKFDEIVKSLLEEELRNFMEKRVEWSTSESFSTRGFLNNDSSVFSRGRLFSVPSSAALRALRADKIAMAVATPAVIINEKI